MQSKFLLVTFLQISPTKTMSYRICEGLATQNVWS